MPDVLHDGCELRLGLFLQLRNMQLWIVLGLIVRERLGFVFRQQLRFVLGFIVRERLGLVFRQQLRSLFRE